MSKSFTRQELYDLVWSEPMKNLASRFELSDVGLAKTCKKMKVPRPPRGYWAKLEAGKKVHRPELPAREPGMADRVEVGRSQYSLSRSHANEELLAHAPKRPEFTEDVATVAEKIRDAVPTVVMPRFPHRAHEQIQRYLSEDEARKHKPSWIGILFDDKFEKRRFRVLNAIMTGLEKAGMKPHIQGRDARKLWVGVNCTDVYFTLDAASQKHDPFRDASVSNRGSSEKLRLQILSLGWSSDVRKSWEDNSGSKLEDNLTDIVVELMISGEIQYREQELRRYEWLVKRQAELRDELRRKKEEAARRERERVAALEKARLDGLLEDAEAFYQANKIRDFVADVEALFEAGRVPVARENLGSWRSWALKHADRMDPVRSGRFVKSINDDDGGDGVPADECYESPDELGW